jgi:two-component system cell cycle sensor histidine kinase/response regulator CckA
MTWKTTPLRAPQYLVALVTPFAVAGLILIAWSGTDRSAISPYLIAIVLSAWYGGFGPGICATTLSIFICDYFFIHDLALLPLAPDQFDDLLALLAVGIVVSILNAIASRARVRAERSAASTAESEERYRTLFEYAPDGIITADSDQYYLDANPSMCRMLGYTHTELIGLHASDIVTEQSALPEAFREIMDSSTSHHQWQMRRKDGSVFDADVIATAMPGGNLLGVIRDVSERRSAEQLKQRQTDLIDSQRLRLNNIVANVPGVVFEAWMKSDEATEQVNFVSDYVETLLGFTVDEWLEKPNFWLSIVHPEDIERVRRTAEADFSAGALVSKRQFRWVAKDGRVVWVESTSSVIKDLAGRPVGRRGVTVDISDRMQAEKELRESEERYRDLVENAHDIIYTQDLSGRYTSVNQAVERLTGFTREESLTMDIADAVAPEYLDRAREMFVRKLAGEEVTAYELEIVAKDGHRVAVEINTRLITEQGVPISIQGIARDVSERNRLEEQFRQSQKMEAIGQLAGGIAHDFNNLLTVITGYCELSLQKLRKDDPLRSQQSQILKASERAAGLTRQLLAFSRKQLLQLTILDLNDVVSDVERMLHRLIGEHIELLADLETDLCSVKADRTQIEQLLINLAVNARDAMPEGGHLTIQTKAVDVDELLMRQYPALKTGRYAMIAVSDNGTGMDEATQSRIFEPFFTTKETGKGTGLGLSTVYGIVKQSEGNILVSSKLGFGTTFKIYLPCVDVAAPARPIDTDLADDLKGRETILLVEDEEIVRTLTCEILEMYGYRVLSTSGGLSAILLAQGEGKAIDLLLTDVVMPGMSGPETAARITARCPEMTVLYMSGYIDNEIVRAGVLTGDVNFIPKPFSPKVLARKIREVLDEHIVVSNN